MSRTPLPIAIAIGALVVICAHLAFAAPFDEINDPEFLEKLKEPNTTTERPPQQPEETLPANVEDENFPDLPRPQQPLIASARQSLSSGDIHKTMEHLSSAVEQDPSLPPPILMLSYMLMADGQLAAGRQALERAAVQFPGHPEVYLTFGNYSLRQGRPTDAWVHFEKALRLTPPAEWSPSQVDKFRAKCFQGFATVAERRGDLKMAASLLAKWAEVAPDDISMLNRWGEVLFDLKQPQQALEKFALASQKDVGQHPPEVSVAALYVKKGQFEEARNWYEEAAKLYPNDHRVFFEYGGALLLIGEVDAATILLAKSSELCDQDNLDTEIALLRGIAAQMQGDYPQAERLLADALRQSPGDLTAITQLPIVLVEQSDESKRERALRLATIVAQKHPASQPAMATLGWVQYRMGKIDQAEGNLKRAVVGMPREGDSLFYLAQVLLDKGKAAEVEQLVKPLQAAVARPGRFIQRANARRWLKDIELAGP